MLTEQDKGQDFYADSAYTGVEQEKVISKYKMHNKVNEKGYRNKPLTDKQIASNREKSKTRARVEHLPRLIFMLNICYAIKCSIQRGVFGFMEQSMNGLYLRSVGIVRATGIIGLINLTYNLFRYKQVVRLNIL